MNQELTKLKARKIGVARTNLQRLIVDAQTSLKALEQGKVYMTDLTGNAINAEKCVLAIDLVNEIQRTEPDTTWESVLNTALASDALRKKDAHDYPHDEDCPRCGRRQWGLGPLTVNPYHPTDEEQETCGACGWSGNDQG